MPNSNKERYPLVAIPELMFEILHEKVETKQDYGKILTVNEYVQSLLRHVPMMDYLLVIEEHVGEENDDGSLTDLSETVVRTQVYGDTERCRKIRVTESQYEMLQMRQQQYVSNGYRIPLSCILASMIYQYSQVVRDNMFEFNIHRGIGGSVSWNTFTAYQIGADEVKRVRLNFFAKGEDGQWQSYSYSRERELKLHQGNVIVGWKPA